MILFLQPGIFSLSGVEEFEEFEVWRVWKVLCSVLWWRSILLQE